METDAFYRENPPSLQAVTHPFWRQFRFALPDGRFFKVPDVIRDSQTLNRWLVQKKPLDVYYSVAKFLAPERVGPRSETLSQNLFLGADLVFDLDRTPFSKDNLERARLDAVRLSAWLAQADIEVRYRAFSGSKGFHLVCEDPFSYPAESPKEREDLAKARRKIVAERVLEEGIPIDSKVTLDTRRILRLPGTINSKTGLECVVLSPGELDSPIENILNKPKRIQLPSSRIRKEMTDTLQVLRKIGGLHRGEVRSSPNPFYTSFLSSRVDGTPLHAPVVIFAERDENAVRHRVAALQETYRLSDFFLFFSDRYFGFTLDALPERRVEKILRAAKAQNTASFRKFRQAFVRVSPKVDSSMQAVERAPLFIATLPGISLPVRPLSASHARFLESCGVAFAPLAPFAGRGQYVLSHALVEP